MICVLCANPANGSRVCGIGREDLYANKGPMVAHPVCERCHRDPSHRLMNHKLHFTFVTHQQVAVEMARHLDQLSKAGEDLAL